MYINVFIIFEMCFRCCLLWATEFSRLSIAELLLSVGWQSCAAGIGRAQFAGLSVHMSEHTHTHMLVFMCRMCTGARRPLSLFNYRNNEACQPPSSYALPLRNSVQLSHIILVIARGRIYGGKSES